MGTLFCSLLVAYQYMNALYLKEKWTGSTSPGGMSNPLGVLSFNVSSKHSGTGEAFAESHLRVVGPQSGPEPNPEATVARPERPPPSRTNLQPSPDDPALLEMAKQKRPGFEQLLFRKFSEVVHRVAWKLLGPDSDHDDVVHDTFIQIFNAVHTVKDPAKLNHWVVAVAVHTARREIRRRKMRALFPWEESTDTRLHEHWDTYEDADVLRRVYQLLQKLPVEERVVLSLKFFERLTLDEIARACSCSRTTVKRRSRRAQERFARLAALDPMLRNWSLGDKNEEPGT